MLPALRTIVLGAAPELVVNGNFDIDAAGWTATGCTLAAVEGQLELTSTGAGFAGRAQQSFATVVGKTYRLVFDSFTAAGAFRLGTTAGGVDVVTNIVVNVVSGYVVFFVAISATTHLSLVGSAVLGTKNYFDNVSCRRR